MKEIYKGIKKYSKILIESPKRIGDYDKVLHESQLSKKQLEEQLEINKRLEDRLKQSEKEEEWVTKKYKETSKLAYSLREKLMKVRNKGSEYLRQIEELKQKIETSKEINYVKKLKEARKTIRELKINSEDYEEIIKNLKSNLGDGERTIYELGNKFKNSKKTIENLKLELSKKKGENKHLLGEVEDLSLRNESLEYKLRKYENKVSYDLSLYKGKTILLVGVEGRSATTLIKNLQEELNAKKILYHPGNKNISRVGSQAIKSDIVILLFPVLQHSITLEISKHVPKNRVIFSKERGYESILRKLEEYSKSAPNSLTH